MQVRIRFFPRQPIITFLLDLNDKLLIGYGQIDFKQMPNFLVTPIYPFLPDDVTSSIFKLVVEELTIVSKVMEGSCI